MNGNIRKISVGTNYPDGVLHYQVDKQINLVGNPYTITDILIDRALQDLGRTVYNIYISNDNGKILWKSVEGLPVVLEYNITFN